MAKLGVLASITTILVTLGIASISATEAQAVTP